MKAYKEEIIVLKKLARDNLMYGGANASAGGGGAGESEGKDAGAANTDKVLNELIALKEKNEGLEEEVKTARKENQSLRARVEEVQRELENEKMMGDRVRMSKELFKNKLEEMQLKYGKEAVTIPEEQPQQPQQAQQPQQQDTIQHRTPKPLPQIPQQPQQTTPPSTPGVSFEKEDRDQTRGSSSVKQEEFYVGYVVIILVNYHFLFYFYLFYFIKFSDGPKEVYRSVIHGALYEPSVLLFDRINELSETFKSDSNRRQFAHVLKTFTDQVPENRLLT
mgnify:CR=1 FL=1